MIRQLENLQFPVTSTLESKWPLPTTLASSSMKRAAASDMRLLLVLTSCNRFMTCLYRLSVRGPAGAWLGSLSPFLFINIKILIIIGNSLIYWLLHVFIHLLYMYSLYIHMKAHKIYKLFQKHTGCMQCFSPPLQLQ